MAAHLKYVISAELPVSAAALPFFAVIRAISLTWVSIIVSELPDAFASLSFSELADVLTSLTLGRFSLTFDPFCSLLKLDTIEFMLAGELKSRSLMSDPLL